jgi:hypothetical protein
MALVQSSNRQRRASALWISAGVGGLVLFTHHWNVSSRPADDWLAPIAYAVRAAEFLYGWACIWIGIIPLITTRPHMRILALAAAATLAGAFVGSAFAVSYDADPSTDTHDWFVLIGTTLCAYVFVRSVLDSESRRQPTASVDSHPGFIRSRTGAGNEGA